MLCCMLCMGEAVEEVSTALAPSAPSMLMPPLARPRGPVPAPDMLICLAGSILGAY